MFHLTKSNDSLDVHDDLFRACFPSFIPNKLQVDENDIVEKYTNPGADHDYQVLKFSDQNQETIQIITPDKSLCKFIVQDKDCDEDNIIEDNDGEEDFEWHRDESKVIFATESELYLLTSEKVQTTAGGEKVLECEDCSYKTFRKSNMLRHSKTAHALKRHECPECGTNFADSCSLKRHMRTAHEHIIYTCELCDFKSTRASSIKEHTKVVHYNVRFECAECGFSGTSRRALRRHHKSKHSGLKEPVECVQMERDQELLDQQVSFSHVSEAEKNTFEADGGESKVTVNVNIKTALDSLSQDCDKSDPYKCEVCHHVSKSKSDLKIHLETEHLGVSFKCEECDFRSKKKAKLNEHIRIVHKGIRFTCVEEGCNFSGTTRFNLNRHVASVHEGITHKCPHCDYKTTQQTHLKAHINSRHNDVKFKCDLCAFECFTPHGLSQHKRSAHEGIRYNCHLCDYKATQKTNLRVHVKKVHHVKSPSWVK